MRKTVIFREEATGALSSPEQLGSTLRPVKPATGLALFALVAGLFAAIAGAIMIEVPITVYGPGVIISSKGVLEFTVTAQHEGRITSVHVKQGDEILPGQTVAILTQPTLETDLEIARAEHQQASQELHDIRELQKQVEAAIGDLHQKQENDTLESVNALEVRVAALEQSAINQQDLLDKKLIMIDRYLHTTAELAEARDKLAEKRTSLVNMSLNRIEQQTQNRREEITLENRIAAAEREISRLEARQRRESIIHSTESGIVSEIKVVPGDLVRFGTAIVGLIPTDATFSQNNPDSHRLVAAVFLSPSEGKKVHMGMRTLLEPASVRRDVYGAIIGRVISISTVPQTPQEMNRLLRNDELVTRLMRNGPPFLVMVELERSDSETGDFIWTSSKGPSMPLTIGTPVYGDVETERTSIISLILPAIRELLRGPDR